MVDVEGGGGGVFKTSRKYFEANFSFGISFLRYELISNEEYKF